MENTFHVRVIKWVSPFLHRERCALPRRATHTLELLTGPLSALHVSSSRNKSRTRIYAHQHQAARAKYTVCIFILRSAISTSAFCIRSRPRSAVAPRGLAPCMLGAAVAVCLQLLGLYSAYATGCSHVRTRLHDRCGQGAWRQKWLRWNAKCSVTNKHFKQMRRDGWRPVSFSALLGNFLISWCCRRGVK